MNIVRALVGNGYKLGHQNQKEKNIRIQILIINKMKKRILIIAALQFFLTLNSCSSDSGDNPVTTPEQPPVVVVKTAKITSYSKNSKKR